MILPLSREGDRGGTGARSDNDSCALCQRDMRVSLKSLDGTKISKR